MAIASNRIKNGDRIRLDAITGELQLLVSDETLSKREIAIKTNYSDQTGLGRELFNNFRKLVSSAELGASSFD